MRTISISSYSPAYFRRQKRRKAAKTADATVAASVEVNNSEPSADKVNGDDFFNMNSAEIGNTSVNNENSAEEAENYHCEICDFKSNWTNGLKIHMSRRHSKIEQIDGNYDSEEDENYWKDGKISQQYQSFLDVNKIIEESELSEIEQKI